MDFLLGITGKDFTLLCADTNAARSIMLYTQSQDKIRTLDSHKMLAVGGDSADCIQEPDYFTKNMQLYALKNGVPLTTKAAASYIRNEKAVALRKGMTQVDLLLAGHDAVGGPALYFMDYLASMQKVDYAAHGYGGFFTNSLLDTHWKKDMSLEQALDVLELCIAEIQKRFMISMPSFTVKVVDANGVRVVERAKMAA